MTRRTQGEGSAVLPERGTTMKLIEVIEQYLIDCENRNRSDGTMHLYQRQLGLMARWLDGQGVQELEEVTVPLMRLFLNYFKHSDSSERYKQAVQLGKLLIQRSGRMFQRSRLFFSGA